VLVCDRNRPVARIVPCLLDDQPEQEQQLIARGILTPPLKKLSSPVSWPEPPEMFRTRSNKYGGKSGKPLERHLAFWGYERAVPLCVRPNTTPQNRSLQTLRSGCLVEAAALSGFDAKQV
jgi:antitoxin (DNA-binding transcriptional repressor) of toxin-antitoxin stability system